MLIIKLRDSFHPYALTTVFLWSIAYVFTRMALRYFSALALGFTRYFVASIALIILSVVMKTKPPQKKDIPWFIMSGSAGFFLYMIFFNIGATYVSASTSSLVIASAPVITSIWAFIIFKEKLKTYQWIAILIEFVGIVFLTLYNGVLDINAGVLLLLVAAVLLSTYNILQRKLTQKYTAFQASTYSILIGTLMLSIFAPVSIKEVSKAPASALLYVCILGVFSSTFAYILWSKAFEKASHTSYVSNYMFLTPFLTSVLGFIIAKEIPDKATVIGGSIILIGAAIFNKDRFLLNFRAKK